MRRIDKGLSGIVKELGLEDAIKLRSIREKWAGLLGQPLVNHIRPQSLQESVLSIQADSPLWLSQVSFFKQDILSRLRPFGVKDIKFRAGPVPEDKKRDGIKEKAPRRQLTTAEREFIEASILPIRDEGLRKQARRIMEKALLSRAT
ncbi:MAG: DUF721 domain-containing protein [Nitrospiraceae bacterium]|nr:DUF721 domain-containing protein [Nitrospiraceae bacterium]